MQRTLVLIKPDAMKRGLKKSLMLDFMNQGFLITRQRELVVTKELILSHYKDVINDNPTVPLTEMFLAEYVGQTITAIELSSPSPTFVQDVRRFIGATDPAQADPKSMRGRYGDDSMAASRAERRVVRNLVHASDSDAAAAKEIALWFD